MSNPQMIPHKAIWEIFKMHNEMLGHVSLQAPSSHSSIHFPQFQQLSLELGFRSPVLFQSGGDFIWSGGKADKEDC